MVVNITVKWKHTKVRETTMFWQFLYLFIHTHTIIYIHILEDNSLWSAKRKESLLMMAIIIIIIYYLNEFDEGIKQKQR